MSQPLSRSLGVVVVVLTAACSPGAPPAGDAGAADDVPAREAFAWRTLAVDDADLRWGAVFAGEGEGGLVVGGVEGTDGPVSPAVRSLSVSGDVLAASLEAALDVPRFCGCALLDESREELVVIGGRDNRFAEVRSVVVIPAGGGGATTLEEPGDVASSPVGCAALFFPALDRGYVFGGAGQASGFSGDTWRYDPADRSFTRLDIAGPSPRYDAVFKRAGEGRALLAGGMGAGALGATFHADVWRFDAAAEQWTEVQTGAAGDAPAGRRVPWLALAPDDDTLLFGFGSDSQSGATALGDLWRLSLSSGEWTALEVELEAADAPPAPRGFAPWVAGPEGSAGLLLGGYNGVELLREGFALYPPDELGGLWR